MKVKKSSLEVLFNVTKKTDGVLTLSEARIRDGFIKPLAETTQTFFNDREAIYKKFCLKNEEGEPDLVDGNKYQFNPGQEAEINAELQILLNEEVDIEFPEKIKEILEKSEYWPKIGEAEVIDQILNTI